MSETAATPTAKESPMALLDWGLLIGAAGIWGASFLFMVIGLDAFSPGVVTFLRIAFGAATVAFLPSSRSRIERRDLKKIVLLGFTWMAFPLTLFPIAEQWIDSSMAGMLNSAMPLVTVLISWRIFSVSTGPRRLFGVMIGLIGILFIGVPEATGAGTNAVGVILVVLAVSSYGVEVNIAGPLQHRYGSLPVVSRSLGFATVMSVPYALIGLPSSHFAWGPLVACFALGAGGTGLAFAMAATLTGRVGPVRTSVITYVMPAVSIALGVVFRDETVAWTSLVGTAIVLVGAWLSSRRD